MTIFLFLFSESSGGNYLDVTVAGIAEAEAEVAVPSGIVVMKNAIMGAMGAAVKVDVMTRESTTMMIVGGPGAEALDVAEGEEAGVLVAGGIGAQLGKVVLKGGLKLNNGTGKENRKKQEIRITVLIATLIAMVTCKMEGSTMMTLSSSNNNKEDMVTSHN